MNRCIKCKLPKSAKDFNKNTTRALGRQSVCRVCEKIHRKQYYRNNKNKFLGYNKKRRAKISAWFQQFKESLKCIKCGEKRWYLLDFHHRNSDEKDIEISTLVRHRTNRAKLMAEIEKCDVLCSNCHRELHYFERIYPGT